MKLTYHSESTIVQCNINIRKWILDEPKDETHVTRLGMCSTYWAWTCILKSLFLQSIPSGKGHPTWTSWERFHMDTYLYHRDVEQWGPPGFWHWITYQLLYQGQPTARVSPLSAITQSTLLNLWFCFIHLQKESPRPDTSSSAWTLDQHHEEDFLVPD